MILKLKQLKEVSGQPYVVDNGYLFVFVLDYYRHNLINENVDFDMQTSFESAEGLLVGAIDVALVSENVAPKPRLPFEHVFHKTFTIAMLKNKEAIQKYDEEISEYYKERTNGKRQETWSQQVAGFLSGKTRLDMLEELNKSGLMKNKLFINKA